MYKNRTIIDVRTPNEFMEGHIEGSINIPLQEIPLHIDEIKQFDCPILCCAVGGRSQQAVDYLKALDICCENGGGWMEINEKRNL